MQTDVCSEYSSSRLLHGLDACYERSGEAAGLRGGQLAAGRQFAFFVLDNRRAVQHQTDSFDAAVIVDEDFKAGFRIRQGRHRF